MAKTSPSRSDPSVTTTTKGSQTAQPPGTPLKKIHKDWTPGTETRAKVRFLQLQT